VSVLIDHHPLLREAVPAFIEGACPCSATNDRRLTCVNGSADKCRDSHLGDSKWGENDVTALTRELIACV